MRDPVVRGALARPGARPPIRRAALLLALAVAAFCAPARAVTTLPPDFVLENVMTSGTFSAPLSVKWLPDGRMLVAEKQGRVWAVKNGVKHSTPMWLGDAEVLNSFDRGLIDIAVDPGYAKNRYVYLLYTVDPDTNLADDNGDGFGRLTRYQVSAVDSNVFDLSTRTILMGVDWPNGPLIASPSHTVGSLRWGSDGSLLVSTGEGAQFFALDSGGLDSAAFGVGKTDPYEDIGAFRSQYLGSLAGKILRIDPATGHGYPSNPYWDGNPTSPRSKVWAYGLRNPFRFCVEPGTGSTDPADGDPGILFLGDVGWESFEDLNIVTEPGQNFGWPCYEGMGPQPDGYPTATPAHHGCGTIGTPDNPAPHRPPVASWHHFGPGLGTPPGFVGRASIGGAFYTGTRYPAEWRNRYFFVDFGRGWIKVLDTDASYALVAVRSFADTVETPVYLDVEPGTGDLIYISLFSGTIRRVRYIGTLPNADPVAVAAGTPTAGTAPLTVDFTSAGTEDPDEDPLTLSWAFGDGDGSPDANPEHKYDTPGVWNAVLTAADGLGGIGRDTVIVTVLAPTGFPTTGVLDDFNRADGPIGGNWSGAVAGLAVDAQSLVQTSSPSSARWNPSEFGPVQEAYVTLASIDGSAPSHDLLLKVQAGAPDSGCIEVRWDAAADEASVHTYTPGIGWEARGGPFALALGPGGPFGARATPDGTVQVFGNGVLAAAVSIAGWPFAAQGGSIGFELDGAPASRLDDFGGGNTVFSTNTPPSVSITVPADTSFFAEGDTIWMRCLASDAQDPPHVLAYHWVGDLHHNVHVHPASFLSDSATTFMIGENHDDGTGVWWHIRLHVTDSGGLADTADVYAFPEVDLEPSAVTTAPVQPTTTESAIWQFQLRNHGRLPAPRSRWRLVTGSTTLAEGDTLVPALDSVGVAVTLPPTLAPGTWVVRAVADTLDGVVETNETNNASMSAITVVDGNTLAVPGTPVRLALSAPFPNPSAKSVELALDLPAEARIEFAIHDLLGREVWRAAPRQEAAGRTRLTWSGRTSAGDPAAAGIYYARVLVDGAPLVRRFARVR